MKLLLASSILFLSACSSMNKNGISDSANAPAASSTSFSSESFGRAYGFTFFIGKRWAAGVEMPLGRLKPGVGFTLSGNTPPEEVLEGEPPVDKNPIN